MCACVSGVWNSALNRSNSARAPATGRASSSASRNSGLSASSLTEVVELPHLVADHDADVPERVQERPQEPLLGGADAPAEQHEQIDVGMEAEMTAPVAAEREDDHALGRRAVRKQLPQHRVDAIRIALERAPSTGAAPDVGRQFRARRGQRRRQPGTCRARLGHRHIVMFASRCRIKHMCWGHRVRGEPAPRGAASR